MEIASRDFCCFALPPPQNCPGSPVTPQRERSGKCSHLGTYRSQAPFQTLSPSFRGKGKGAFIDAAEVAQWWREPPSETHGSLPHCGPRLRLKGLPREASLVCTGQLGTTARRPGLLSGPVCYANCWRVSRLGPLVTSGSRNPLAKNRVLRPKGLFV